MSSGQLIRLEQQPDYPVVDLSPNNVEMFGRYWLVNEPGIDAQAKILAAHQRVLFSVAVTALGMKGAKIEDAPEEYIGFRRGFASVEFMANVLRFIRSEGDTMVRNAQIMFSDADFFDANALADRRDAWHESHRNTYDAVITAGEALGESITQLQARSIGAQVAVELRNPLLAA